VYSEWGPGCNLLPAPASVGATGGLSYFHTPPSTGNPSTSTTAEIQARFNLKMSGGIADTKKTKKPDKMKHDQMMSKGSATR